MTGNLLLVQEPTGEGMAERRRVEACRVLLVEDDVSTARLLQIQIENHDVDIVGSFVEFEKKWSPDAYDVVLLDLVLPDSQDPKATYERARKLVTPNPMMVVGGYQTLTDFGLLPGAWIEKGDISLLQTRLDRIGTHLEEIRLGQAEQVVVQVRLSFIEQELRELKFYNAKLADLERQIQALISVVAPKGPALATRIGEIFVHGLQDVCSVVVKERVVLAALVIIALAIGWTVGAPVTQWLQTAGVPVPLPVAVPDVGSP